MQVVGNGAVSATYSYLANSPMVEQIAFANNGSAVMTTRKTYDKLNRLRSISTLNPQQATLNSFSYQYNDANRKVYSKGREPLSTITVRIGLTATADGVITRETP
jgi:hypothetical protein